MITDDKKNRYYSGAILGMMTQLECLHDGDTGEGRMFHEIYPELQAEYEQADALHTSNRVKRLRILANRMAQMVDDLQMDR